MSIIVGHQLAKDSCPWTGAQHTEGMAVGVPMQVPYLPQQKVVTGQAGRHASFQGME